MAICPNCGALNQAGSTTCVQCGKPMEVIPSWLELLLARYGETMPTFEGILVKRAPSIAPTEPFTAQRASSSTAQLSTSTELEDEKLLNEIEKLKRSIKEQPAETQQPEETTVSAALPTASKGVDDWLAELRALQEKAALDSTPAMPSEAGALEAAQQAPYEVLPGEEDSSPSPEFLGETTPSESPGITQAGPPAPSIEERLGMLVTPPDTAESVPENSAPEWLRELGLVQPEQPPAPSSGDSVQASETLGPSPVAEADITGEPSGSPPDEEIPDWLKRLIAISSQIPESPPPSEVAEPMQALAHEEAETPPVAEPTPGEPLPDWLRELEAIQTTQLSTTMPPEGEEITPPRFEERATISAEEIFIPPLPKVEEGTVPTAQQEEPSPTVGEEHPAEWLAELEELIERPPTSQPTPFPVEEEVPDWLRELAAEKPEAKTEPQATVAQETPQPEPAELPEWISQLRPTERIAEMPPAEPIATPLEETAPTSGQDVIETLRARLGIPQVPDVEGAEMFHEIVSEPAETTLTPVLEEVEPTPQRNSITVIIWALVFAAILLGIAILSLALLARIQEMLGEVAFQHFLNTPAAAGLVASLEQFRKPITAIRQGDVVLLSIDYTPATAAEMQPLASVVLHDLLERRARVLTVSLQPEGAPLAQRLLDETDRPFPYGKHTLNLGYLPGEAIGVRSLARLPDRQLYAPIGDACQSLGECPGWHDIRGIENVALFIAIADSGDSVRWWIEQLPVLSPNELPLLAAVSAAALPTVRPYLIPASAAPSRLSGLIGGMMATAAYEVYSGRPGRALNMVAAQSAAHLGLVAVALAGIFAGIRSRTGHC